MQKPGSRVRIVDGPSHLDFVYLLPMYARNKNPLLKKALFILEQSDPKFGREAVILLTITEATMVEDKVRGWHFRGTAGGRSFVGFFSTFTRKGWIEAEQIEK